MKATTYDKWEDEVTSCFEEHASMSRSDAQSIVEANSFYLSQAWGMEMNAFEAYVHLESKIYSNGENS